MSSCFSRSSFCLSFSSFCFSSKTIKSINLGRETLSSSLSMSCEERLDLDFTLVPFAKKHLWPVLPSSSLKLPNKEVLVGVTPTASVAMPPHCFKFGGGRGGG